MLKNPVSAPRCSGLRAACKSVSATEQKVVKPGLILQDEHVQVVREREDDVEIARIEKLLLTRFDPTIPGLRLALVAMPVTATVVGDRWISATLRTNIDMAAERRIAAPRDGPDDLELLNTQGVSVDKVVALRAKDIGHLQCGPGHAPFFFRRLGLAPSPEMGSVSIGLFTNCM